MSKKLIFVLLILFLSISTLIYVKINLSQSTSSLPAPVIKSVPKPLNETFLSFLPNPIIVGPGQNSSVDIILDTSLNPTLTQIELAYDPRLLYNVSISPGNYFLNPEIILEKIDIKNGRISYGLKGDVINKTESTIATVNFATINYGIQRETNISFLPKTLVRNTAGDIKVNNIYPGTIIIKPVFYAPVSSVSAYPVAN